MVQFLNPDEYDRLAPLLLRNMKKQARPLRELLEKVNGHRCYEDGIYRFYHESPKVFDLQDDTKQIVAALAEIAPEGRAFSHLFREVIATGTGKKWEMGNHWYLRTKPIMLAFLHAKYFLEMAVEYAGELKEPPQAMPSGWAALLCLYGLR